MIATATNAQQMTEVMLPLARDVARRYPSRGVQREDIQGEAYVALCKASQDYFRQEADPGDPEKWIASRIRSHLSAYVRDQLFPYLAGVPDRLKRTAVKVHLATERVKARGIPRPTYEQIAGEANISLDKVKAVAEIRGVVVRQTAVECYEDPAKLRGADPFELVPAFGPQPGFEEHRPCSEVIRHPIRKGSSLCCMACHASGMDHHPALRRDRMTDPKPEKKPVVPQVESRKPQKEKRKERRSRLYPPQVAAVSA